MRRRLASCALVGAAMLLAAVNADAFNRVDRHRDIIGYNVLLERVFIGSAAGEMETVEGMMYFTLKTSDMMLSIQLGPKDFVERLQINLNPGDNVTVIGMPAMVHGRSAVLARQIRTKYAIVKLRNMIGVPLWENNEPMQMDPERRPDLDVC